MGIERDAFRDCLSRASLEFAQQAADRIAFEAEEAELEKEMEQDSELAELVALKMGLL